MPLSSTKGRQVLARGGGKSLAVSVTPGVSLW